MLKLQDRVLATSDPADWDELAKETREGRLELTRGMQEIEGQVKLLQLEVTRGRTSAADLAMVFDKLKELAGRLYGLTTFVVSPNWLHGGSSVVRVLMTCSCFWTRGLNRSNDSELTGPKECLGWNAVHKISTR